MKMCEGWPTDSSVLSVRSSRALVPTTSRLDRGAAVAKRLRANQHPLSKLRGNTQFPSRDPSVISTRSSGKLRVAGLNARYDSAQPSLLTRAWTAILFRRRRDRGEADSPPLRTRLDSVTPFTANEARLSEKPRTEVRLTLNSGHVASPPLRLAFLHLLLGRFPLHSATFKYRACQL